MWYYAAGLQLKGFSALAPQFGCQVSSRPELAVMAAA